MNNSIKSNNSDLARAADPGNFFKPRKVCVPVADAVRWRGNDCLLQRKYDGEFEVRTVQMGGLDITMAGEFMKHKAGGLYTAADHANFAKYGVWMAAFDLLTIGGLDVSSDPLRWRWAQLCALAPYWEPRSGLVLAESGFGGEFVSAVLDTGGEGVVAKPWQMPWNTVMWAAKPLQTFYCMVTGFCGGRQTVKIARIDGDKPHAVDVPSIVPCGTLAMRGLKCDRVRIGSIVKVEALGLTPAGLLREARLCADTATSWLVKY